MQSREEDFMTLAATTRALSATSVLAIIALVCGRYLGWVWLDPVIGIVGAVVIARWSVTLLRQTSAVLLDTVNPRLFERIRTAIEGPADARIVDLHVWRVGPGAHVAVVSVSGTITRAEVCRRVQPLEGIAHLTVEIADER